jgi:outer membrane receptor protein involved in Fe transport
MPLHERLTAKYTGLLLLLLSGSVHAQEGDLGLEDLSDLSLSELLEVPVVTGSGRAEERSLAAANVFIVTRDQIERAGHRSLAEILRQVPGLYVVDDHVTPSVGVREVTGGYRGGTRILKIMIDGFPVNFRPDLEAFIGPEFIPIEAVERVEVAKGPLSALYGANAFLATVNVITRKPSSEATEVSARYRVVNGNSGSGVSALASAGEAGKGILLAASTDRIDRSGLSLKETYENQTTPEEVLSELSQGDEARPLSAFGRVDYEHQKLGHFTLEGGYQELDSGAEYQINSLMTHRSRVNVENRWLTLAWQTISESKFHARGYAGYSSGDAGSNYELFLTSSKSSAYRPKFGYRAFNGLLEFGYDFADAIKIDAGMDLEVRDEDVLYYRQVLYRSDATRQPFDEIDLIAADAPRSHDYLQVGPYLQIHSRPLADVPDFRITGTVRGDLTNFGPVDYPLEPSYRGAVAYRFGPALTLKAIGGRAFQAPSGTLLFAHPGFGNSQNVVGSERLNNPRALVPQVVSSGELVAVSQIANVLTIEASAYYQKLEDVIRFNRVASTIVAKNSGSEEIAGGEIYTQVNLGRVRPYGAASASSRLSSEITRDLQGVTDVEGLPTAYPRLFGYAGVGIELLDALLYCDTVLRFAGARGASQAHYYLNDSESYELPGYAELDVTVSTGPVAILAQDRRTRVLVSGRNLLGADVREPGYGGVDIPQDKTSFFAQIRQEL